MTGTLIELAEKRERAIAVLSSVVVTLLDELDPDHSRERTATSDLGPWVRLDSFDRLRRGHDQILALELQAGIVVKDLRGMLRLQPAGSLERPVGYIPERAHMVLIAMAVRRADMLRDMGNAERALRPKVGVSTSAALRVVLRYTTRMESEERKAAARLSELLTVTVAGSRSPC